MSEIVKITAISGTAVPIRGNDIDTDRIIPARYLKEPTFARMGNYPFFDERFDSSGKKKDHPLNDPEYRGASLLFVNKNFGCGSSRGHAAQALYTIGITAIVREGVRASGAPWRWPQGDCWRVLCRDLCGKLHHDGFAGRGRRRQGDRPAHKKR